MRGGPGGFILLLLFILLCFNLPIGGLTLMQRTRAGMAEAGRYAQSRAAGGAP